MASSEDLHDVPGPSGAPIIAKIHAENVNDEEEGAIFMECILPATATSNWEIPLPPPPPKAFTIRHYCEIVGNISPAASKRLCEHYHVGLDLFPNR